MNIDKEFILNPDGWSGDFICMKNYKHVVLGSPPEFGVMKKGDQCTIYNGPYDIISDLVVHRPYDFKDRCDLEVFHHYESLDDLLEDGWIVD